MRVLLCFFSLLLSSSIHAQTDTEFWFVAPEVTDGYDSPILLRISAFSEAASITLSEPANPSFMPVSVLIQPNTTYSIDLTPFINQVENKPAGLVLNYGLFLKSNAPVTAYYEVNKSNNPDIFSLKGNNAKGKEFYTPFQTRYATGNYPGPPTSAFDIVATEDSTLVNITPTKNILGHLGGIPFTILLNRGQTFSCATNIGSPSARLAGSHILADKPICVTIKDDLVQNGGCADLHGDQLVPVDIIGTDYIAMRGNLSTPEQVYILATNPGTEVYLNGATTPVATLNTGEQVEASLSVGDSTLYIHASAPVYVLHLAGFTCEMGAALLPPIQCTGSSTVFFNRSTTEYFALNIMCKTGSEPNFSLNGNAALVPASAFHPVIGSGGIWQSAQISYSTAQIPVGIPSLISNNNPNDNLFHLGIIHGGNATGCRFGYFSDYSSLNLGDNRTVCSNDTVLLDAGAGKTSYSWSTGDTTRFLMAIREGSYWVTTKQAGCTFTDTVNIAFDTTQISLGNDTTICQGDTINLLVPSGFTSYQWQDHSSEPIYPVTQTGAYILNVLSYLGCNLRDTVEVLVRPLPSVPLIEADSLICAGDTLTLFATGDAGVDLHWIGPDSSMVNSDSLIIPHAGNQQAGIWRLTQVLEGCIGPEASIFIRVEAKPQPVILGDTLICEGSSANLSAPGNYSTWLWSDGSSTESTNAQPGIISVTVTSEAGCSGTSPTVLVESINLEAAFDVHPAIAVPLGTTLQFNDQSTGTVLYPPTDWFWDFGNGASSPEKSPQFTYSAVGNYLVTLTVSNAESCSDTIQLTVQIFDQLIIPNAFSPNQDGINDVFHIQNLEFFPNSELWIFNRWGKLVYSSNNYQNNWEGKNLPDGTYFYILKQGNSDKEFKGTVYMSK